MISSPKEEIVRHLAQGIRFDGRKPVEFRPIIIERNVLETAEGSARVRIGDTEVLVGVKLQMDKPFPDTPDEGVLMVGAELLPIASPEFESGPPDIKSIELARVVDKGIRESKAVDNKRLCIKAGEKVWSVMVDIVPLNDAGNLLDAAGIGALAALQCAVFPSLEESGTAIAYREPRTSEKLPLRRAPLPITVYKIGKTLLVDPTIEEEKNYDARLTVAVTEKDTVCALQKGGDKGISSDEVVQMVDIAIAEAKKIRKML